MARKRRQETLDQKLNSFLVGMLPGFRERPMIPYIREARQTVDEAIDRFRWIDESGLEYFNLYVELGKMLARARKVLRNGSRWGSRFYSTERLSRELWGDALTLREFSLVVPEDLSYVGDEIYNVRGRIIVRGDEPSAEDLLIVARAAMPLKHKQMVANDVRYFGVSGSQQGADTISTMVRLMALI